MHSFRHNHRGSQRGFYQTPELSGNFSTSWPFRVPRGRKKKIFPSSDGWNDLARTSLASLGGCVAAYLRITCISVLSKPRQKQIHFFRSLVTSKSCLCLETELLCNARQTQICKETHNRGKKRKERKTAETRAATWTHFYCNSSIESKKVLININTMPMLKSPPTTPFNPPFPSASK